MSIETVKAAKQHVNLYQSNLDRDGWSDDVCIDIVATFGTKMKIDVWNTIIDEILRSGNTRLDGWLKWCRDQRRKELP